MLKKVIFAAFLAVAALSSRNHAAGGYSKAKIQQLINDENFKIAETKARQDFQSKRNSQLGRLISVEQQVVAGMNYRMVFESPQGQYEITVFVQPWTETYEVTSVQSIAEVL